MPEIILIRDIGLHSTEVHVNGSEVLLVIRSIESLPSLSNLIEQLSPSVHIITKSVIDLHALQVPESLVLLPDIEVIVGLLADALDRFISFGDVNILELLDQF